MVPNVARKTVLPGNGTGPYAFNFKVQSASQITVQKRVGSTITDLDLTDDYSVSLTNGGVNGGVVTLVDGSLVSADSVLIEGATVIEQTTPYANLGPFNAYRHEVSYDKLTFVAQELSAKLAATVKIPAIDSTGLSVTLPVAAARANKAIVFDASGNIGVSLGNFDDSQVYALLSQAWASKVDGIVDTTDYSSKAYAIGGTGVTGIIGSSKEWAISPTSPDGSSDLSAKSYAALTAADAIATAGDRVQTGLDRTAAENSAAAAAAAAAQGLYNDVVELTSADSPYVPSLAEEGTMFRLNMTSGPITINLSALSVYGDDMKFAFVKVDGTANDATINRGGTDTISGNTSLTISNQYENHVLIGDSGSGSWIDTVQATGIPDGAITTDKIADGAVTTDKIADEDVTPAKLDRAYQELNPRVQTVTSAATVTPTNLNDAVVITAQAEALALANPSGSMVQCQALIVRIKDDGTARAISYDTNYREVDVELPTTTVLGKTLYLGMVWNATDTKYDVLVVRQEA